MPIKLKPLRNCGPVKAAFLRRKNKMVHRGALMPAQHRAPLLNSVTRAWRLLGFVLLFGDRAPWS